MTELLMHPSPDQEADKKPTRKVIKGLPSRYPGGGDTGTYEFEVAERSSQAGDLAKMNTSTTFDNIPDSPFPLMFADEEYDGMVDFHITEGPSDSTGEDAQSTTGRRPARHQDPQARPLGVIGFAKQRYSEEYRNALADATGEMATHREKKDWLRDNRRKLMLGAAATTLAAILPEAFERQVQRLNPLRKKVTAEQEPHYESVSELFDAEYSQPYLAQLKSEQQDETQASADSDILLSEIFDEHYTKPYEANKASAEDKAPAPQAENRELSRRERKGAERSKRRRQLIALGGLGTAAAGLLAFAISNGPQPSTEDESVHGRTVASDVFKQNKPHDVDARNDAVLEEKIADQFDGKAGSTDFTKEGLREFNKWVDGYKVKKGDTDWGLAEKYLNHIGIDKPTKYQIDAVKDDILREFKAKGYNDAKGHLKSGDIIKIK